MIKIYLIFIDASFTKFDFSDQAQIDLFNHESRGLPIRQDNGFAIGKKMLNITVAMWREDLQEGLLFKKELYDDEKFPHWWLDKVLKTL